MPSRAFPARCAVDRVHGGDNTVPIKKFTHIVNSAKGVACGFMVWFLLLGILKVVWSQPIFDPLEGGLKILVLVAGPLVVYPGVLWGVLRYQLPPLSADYIRRHWPLWIPGFLVASLPSVDILILGKRLIGRLFG